MLYNESIKFAIIDTVNLVSIIFATAAAARSCNRWQPTQGERRADSC